MRIDDNPALSWHPSGTVAIARQVPRGATRCKHFLRAADFVRACVVSPAYRREGSGDTADFSRAWRTVTGLS